MNKNIITQIAKDTYNNLRECFISNDSNYTDKAWRFRRIFEGFAKRMTPSLNTTLDLRLKKIFRENRISCDNINKSDDLRQTLNKIIHNEQIEISSPEELRKYYKDLLEILSSITQEKPDEKSLILSGIQKEWYIEGLNTEQVSAVIDDAQVIDVNAGPGTGKTHLLVHKMLYYLKDNSERSIVALTFTNTAADQLLERFIEVKNKSNNPSEVYPNCRTATIHSYCFHCLTEYYKTVGKSFEYEIVEESDYPSIAEEIAIVYNCINEKNKIISILKNEGYYTDNTELVNKVKKYKQKHHFIQVDEILYLFKEESEKNEIFKKWLEQRIDCLLIDESQDLSKSIYNVIRIFTDVNPNMFLFFVGDPRQNIFRFNGGSYRNLIDFLKERKVSKHTLKLTYRCPQAVIDKVNPLVFKDCENPNLKLANTTLNGTCKILRCDSKESEAKKIAEYVRNLNDNPNTCVMAAGLWYLEDVAKELNIIQIPFIIRGGTLLLKKPIKIVNHCLRIINENNENNKNNEYSNRQLLRNVQNYNNSRLYEFLHNKKHNNESLRDTIIKISELLKQQNTINNDSDDEKLIKQYAEVAKDYPAISDISNLLFDCSARKKDTFSGFYKRNFKVESVTPITNGSTPLVLTTIHSAKGLEWKNVILAGVAQGFLPSYHCYEYEKDITPEQQEEKLNDEKKMYYVAVTRCKENLTLTYPSYTTNRYGGIRRRNMSEFVI